ncbi:MAG TPA: nucleotidyltransferase domain-containing protein [Longimicrobiaceae bacterium]|nr:nucleotidyltransferase domain-containing protein [Longimicrobiaceae bacterium]
MSYLRSQLARIAEAYGVRDLYVFGSRAAEISGRVRGERTGVVESESDLDLAVRCPSGCQTTCLPPPTETGDRRPGPGKG